jgi:uncharacterized protein (TIGR02757 family)
LKNLRDKLEYHYNCFNTSDFDTDPVQFPRRFSNPTDIEIMAFIAALFSYGKISQINSNLEKFIRISMNKPYEFILNFRPKQKIHLGHRFYRNEDIKNLFLVLQQILAEYGSLKNFFLRGYSHSDKNVKNAISNFSITTLKLFEKKKIKINHAIKFMFPIPDRGSACKRLNLFLRWMVRKDNIDIGLWNEIPKNKLVIPVDTHIARVSRILQLTKRKNVSWKMAEEITDELKIFDPNDPVKYDFSLCHLSIRGELSLW